MLHCVYGSGKAVLKPFHFPHSKSWGWSLPLCPAAAAAAAAKSLQSCPTLCDPTDDSPTLTVRKVKWFKNGLP